MTAPGPKEGPLGVIGFGLLTQPSLRRILALRGHPLVPGLPSQAKGVAVWGQRASSRKGVLAAQLTGRGVIRIEEAFLRGLDPGQRSGLAPYGLLIDRSGVHYDARRSNDLETLLATHPLNDVQLMARAKIALGRLTGLGLGKYLRHAPDAILPPEHCILVVDQVYGDASVTASGADRTTFLRMLDTAREQHPDHPIVVKAHPAAKGHRGYLRPEDLRPGETWYSQAIAPTRLLSRTRSVFTVSSQLGLDAIWAGHRPTLFGTPIYAGWGLSKDPTTLPRRNRQLSVHQLFAALMILAPVWYDPFRDELTDLETILDIAEAEARAAVADRHGYIATGMALWKRRRIVEMFGGKVSYPMLPFVPLKPRPVLAWASKPASPSAPQIVRVEDGFLRSQGLGARLVPPLSLIADAEGVYYDPAYPSHLERLIASSPDLPASELLRAEKLAMRIEAEGATKYGSRGRRPELPITGQRILVVGQVENDASIKCGATGTVRTNADLLREARATHPDAQLFYKPHPDVEAGLRPGRLTVIDAAVADQVLTDTDPHWILGQVDQVWTITSLMGFEAILRGIPVTCLGAPFYAGWGLTDDRAPIPTRRTAVRGVTRTGLIHATLIGAPRYFDPTTKRICPPEVVLDRLADKSENNRSALLRLAAKGQGIWATVRPRVKA